MPLTRDWERGFGGQGAGGERIMIRQHGPCDDVTGHGPPRIGEFTPVQGAVARAGKDWQRKSGLRCLFFCSELAGEGACRFFE
jgi:hypothetical protein